MPTLGKEEMEVFQDGLDKKMKGWESEYESRMKAIDYPGISMEYSRDMQFDQNKANAIEESITLPLTYFLEKELSNYASHCG